MKKRKLIIISAICLCFICTGSSDNYSVRADSDLYNNYLDTGLNYLELSGNNYEIGKQHGKLLKNEIRKITNLWKQNLEKTFKIKADKFIDEFYKNTNYLESIKKHTPGLLEEVKGISDGSGIDFKTIFVFQLVDEIWAAGSEIIDIHHCTSIGVSRHGDNPTMVAQNLDIPGYYHGFQTLLRILNKETGISSYVFTVAGLIGANGMNNYCLAVDVNTILQIRHSTDGLPVAFIVRGIMKQKNFDDAVKFIKEIKHASGQNYLIGGINEAASFECSASSVVKYSPFDESYFTYHTNHPLANHDFDPLFSSYIKSRYNINAEEYEFVCSRFDVLEKRILNQSAEIDLELIKKTLRSREGIGATINNSSTFGSTIMILKEKPEFLIIAGDPSEKEYVKYEF